MFYPCTKTKFIDTTPNTTLAHSKSAKKPKDHGHCPVFLPTNGPNSTKLIHKKSLKSFKKTQEACPTHKCQHKQWNKGFRLRGFRPQIMLDLNDAPIDCRDWCSCVGSSIAETLTHYAAITTSWEIWECQKAGQIEPSSMSRWVQRASHLNCREL